MQKKILLISPPRTASWNSAVISVSEPLGLAYIAAVLEENDFEVEILDCFILGQHNKTQLGDFVRIGLSDQEIKTRLKESQADIIGISSMFTSLAADSLHVANLAKEVKPKSLVVMGGAHATLAYGPLLSDENVDMVVVGEGETSFLELVKRFYSGDDIKTIAGTVSKDNGRIRCNPPREYIPNLDAIPFPARHLLPMELYFKDQADTTFGYAMRFPVATMITSRGCPYNCIFCSTSKVWKQWRPRGIKSVVDEIEILVNDYGVKEIAFEDDNFIVDKKRVMGLCEEILRRRLNIKWTVPAGLSVWIIDKPMLLKMKKAGFYRVSFPIESGSKETLKFIRKPVDLDRAKQLISFANQIGLWTVGNFIFGFPEEKPESVNKTLQFAEHSGLDMAIFYVAQPYSGSDLYSIYEEKGLLKADSKSSAVDTTYDTLYFSASELSRIRRDVSSKYLKRRVIQYLTPGGLFFNLLPKINSLEKFRYFLRIIKLTMPVSYFLGKLRK